MNVNRRAALKAMLAGAGTLALPGLGRAPGGLGEAAPADSTRKVHGMEPFRIDYGRDAIADLHRRLDQTRWPELSFDTDWSAGTNDRVLRELVAYWRHEYDWFRVQARLNELSHFRAPVGGELLHWVGYEATAPKQPFPLLLLHGWPGSFLEFTRAAPGLTAAGPDGRGFDLITPSLPGFVFSQAPREPGMNPGRVADRLHQLMQDLGYERYGVQGGDWGAIIGTQLARRYPQAVVGFHMNFVSSAPAPPAGTPATADEEAYRARRAQFQAEETGYSSIQGTRPQSLAYAQQDSPVGWLAWMLEKYWAWSDHGGDLWSTYSRDDILTTAMLYWLPGSILSAARLYYETSYRPQGGMSGGPVTVPTGYARFPAEPWGPPREAVERTYNLVHYTEMPRGGHFPALEQPAIWAPDVRRFFSALA